jgi:hypothetical protein
MILHAQRLRRSAAPFSALVGVFEDDALLLRLAERFRVVQPDRSRAVGCFGADGLGFESEFPVEAAAWDL